MSSSIVIFCLCVALSKEYVDCCVSKCVCLQVSHFEPCFPQQWTFLGFQTSVLAASKGLI